MHRMYPHPGRFGTHWHTNQDYTQSTRLYGTHPMAKPCAGNIRVSKMEETSVAWSLPRTENVLTYSGIPFSMMLTAALEGAWDSDEGQLGLVAQIQRQSTM